MAKKIKVGTAKPESKKVHVGVPLLGFVSASSIKAANASRAKKAADAVGAELDAAAKPGETWLASPQGRSPEPAAGVTQAGAPAAGPAPEAAVAPAAPAAITIDPAQAAPVVKAKKPAKAKAPKAAPSLTEPLVCTHTPRCRCAPANPATGRRERCMNAKEPAVVVTEKPEGKA